MLKSRVYIKLLCPSPEEAVNALINRNMELSHIFFYNDLCVSFQINRADYPSLIELCQKRGYTIQEKRQTGFYPLIHRGAARPIILGMMSILLVLTLTLPGRIFFIQVKGNEHLPVNRILEAAENAGVRFAASRKEIRSEKIKNVMLREIPQLQWIGVNTRGCVAILSVQEKKPETASEGTPAVSSIIAARDGIITDCTVLQGSTLCTIGQTVLQGQILISGYTDCGRVLRAGSAQGEVYALTQRDFRAVTPDCRDIKREDGVLNRSYSLLIGKKRINLWKDSGIWDDICDRMYREYYVVLPGGFTLPFGICVETRYSGSLGTEQVSAETAEDMLRTFAANYVTHQMVAGEIIHPREIFGAETGLFTFSGNYLCQEMIGREQPEKIGE